MTSSLGLVGDLDDVDMIEDVEAAFGVRLGDDEIERCSTVGHLFELIEARLPDMPSGKSCATAMGFYRLRRALQPHSAIALKPKTSIAALETVPVRKLHEIIETECGLRPPQQIITLWGCLALLLVLALPFGLFTIGMPWWVALPSAALGIGLYRLAPIQLPGEVETFGDLVRIVASRSIGALAEQGARLGPDARSRDVAGCHQMKALRPDRKRELIDAVRQDWQLTIRRACAALHFDRSTYHYQSRRTDPAFLKKRIKEICETHGGWDTRPRARPRQGGDTRQA